MKTISAAMFSAIVLLACDKSEKRPTTEVTAPSTAASVVTASSSVAAPAKAEPGKAHVDGKNFALDVTSSECKAGAECAIEIVLRPAAEFHVNQEYPYKFLADKTSGVTFLGKEDATTFSKSSGDFAIESERSATMTVRFKAGAAGQANVSGKYKMSVCSADQCQIEQQPVSLVVPVI